MIKQGVSSLCWNVSLSSQDLVQIMCYGGMIWILTMEGIGVQGQPPHPSKITI